MQTLWMGSQSKIHVWRWGNFWQGGYLHRLKLEILRGKKVAARINTSCLTSTQQFPSHLGVPNHLQLSKEYARVNRLTILAKFESPLGMPGRCNAIEPLLQVLKFSCLSNQDSLKLLV